MAGDVTMLTQKLADAVRPHAVPDSKTFLDSKHEPVVGYEVDASGSTHVTINSCAADRGPAAAYNSAVAVRDALNAQANFTWA